MSLIRHKQDWDDLADIDPFWAILSYPEQKFGGWDIDKFFLTGDQEIERVMGFATQLGYPLGRELALDFGCGVGRLTRALATHFQKCYGVDISETMIAKAKVLNQSNPKCTFIVNTEEKLVWFPDSYFDMVYTKHVLHHLPSKSLIESYISEFIRILKRDGLVVFDLPSYIPLKHRLQPRRRLYALLRGLGFSERFLYERIGLYPIRMNFLPQKEVVGYLNAIGARVLEVQADSHSLVQGRTYYVTKQL